MIEVFRDRAAAGRLLADRVARLGLQSPVVVALPRGGDLVAMTGADRDYLEAATRQALQEIARRRGAYLRGRQSPGLESRNVVVVDDGVATGARSPRGIACRDRGGAGTP